MTSIVVVDDDLNVVHLVADYLEREGYTVHQAANGPDALRILEKMPCDLAIVDVMMPEMDGYTLTKIIREQYDIPILLLTAKSRIEDKEQGYLSGTDDYLSKPFEPKELLFRVQALLRRYNKQSERIIRVGNMEISQLSYEVHVSGKTFILPLKEFELLFFLAANAKHVISRDQLIENVWGVDFTGDERTVDVHVKRLRERLAAVKSDVHIKTVRGVGYSLEVHA